MIAAINVNASGDNAIVAAVSGKKIKVSKAVVINQVATANAVKFRTGSSDLHAAMPLPLAVGQGITVDAPRDELQTVAGAALNLNLSAATAVTGYVIYTLE
jgi:hypothetical protein